ncbi:hypothetical protein ABZ807_16330 [Micromonospora sp. NPDC047548]|uniref:hypothetical protein n=1 Tax=Micromonospora sp. NPDC047548 TaxID=3155624 RepID=UPI0033CE0093
MISNNERMRIRRQMQRRIRDVVAERRRARQLESPAAPTAETTETTDTPALTTA